MSSSAKPVPHPVVWVPSLYFAMGIPFSMVIWVAGTMFKDLGHTDGQITVATASIGIAWSLKPLWAAFLDMYRTKRFWVLSMEFALAALFIGIALALPLPNYFQVTIAMMWVLAFSSSTQDITADGIYITALDKKKQAAFIGVQGVFWNVGRLFAVAAIVWIAGTLQESGQHTAKEAWTWAIGLSGATMALLGIYHLFVLPTGVVGEKPKNAKAVAASFWESLIAFFKKDQLWGMLAFVFLFRSAEGLLLVEAPLFLQAPLEEGGIGLTLVQKGTIDGLISISVSLIGGLLGGLFIAKHGLKKSLFIMALCVNIPNLCFVYLSQMVSPESPLSLTTVATLVTIEKAGYSFGFVANMLYMMQQISPGKFHMTHYAFCTALMNLVLVPTQMISGPLADAVGYKTFFIIVCFASIPSLIVAWFAPFPRDERADQAAEAANGT
ncbi:MFS transporter [Synoicihabitans lomoniglobus]|uniref:MFS transporter n=1 Tax=Synoicihabitans lomoniglobus TaxID=2909285 RepID=A0AAF0CQV7_9BACT|nr:MFS transporter [Opitutaceae bacterium LMO-M01]WED66414.1 MFS transporter [Opitutaceae bacterium LMO-M01]